jgi:ABC-type multidrug transport system fused ATPase/permease subunit
LKVIIIQDLQTNETSHFLCNKWLAVEKDDGKIERLLTIATERDKRSVMHLAEKQAKKKLSDNHMWFSIFVRPAQSSFTRLDRVTCCFVLMFLSMMMNIAYYGQDKSPTASGLTLGPFAISATQIGIGIATSLVCFPITLILVQLFRKSKRRVSNLKKMEKYLEKQNKKNAAKFGHKLTKQQEKAMEISQKEKMRVLKGKLKERIKTKNFLLPWWFKIIAYILSFVISAVSIFIIISYGITFGDDKVRKWLTSFVSSIIAAILINEPLKVKIMKKKYLKFFFQRID